MKVKLGKRYRDSITGIEGTATSRCEFINGCVQYQLERLDKDGEIKTDWIDEQRLIDAESDAPVTQTAKAGGGFRSHPDGAS